MYLMQPLAVVRAVPRVVRNLRKLRPTPAVLTMVAVVVGVLLRLAAYLNNRSLWVDEIYLALNITERSFAELWRPLADKGIAPAQYQLGTLYAEGKGVEQNDAIAALWFERAANQGDAAAQYNLGASYIEGLGVKKDEAEAAKWFRKAADQRMAFAQLNLGMLYASGRGVPQDNVEALKWIELAVLGMPPGGPRSDAARALKDIADKMTVEQVMEAKGRARTWRPEAEPK